MISPEEVNQIAHLALIYEIDGSISRSETDAVKGEGGGQANLIVDASILFAGGSGEFNYTTGNLTATEVSKTFEQDFQEVVSPTSILDLLYGQTVSIDMTLSANVNVAATLQGSYALADVDFGDTLKVVGIGLVDPDGNFFPTSSFSITVGFRLQLPALRTGDFIRAGTGQFGARRHGSRRLDRRRRARRRKRLGTCD